MLFFLFRKSYIFCLFLFSKKFILSYEKVEKQTTKILKTNCFQQKVKKNKHYLKVSIPQLYHATSEQSLKQS